MKIKLAIKDLLSYGALAIPLAFASMPIYIHAPDYYATDHGVSLTAIGLLLMFLRFFDAIQDPFIGYMSDKNPHLRPKIMLIASLLLVISFAMLFNPPLSAPLVWFGVFVLLTTTSFSILTINLNSLGGIWSKDKLTKTTIVSYREFLGLLGLMVAVVLPTALQSYMSKGLSFHYMSGVLAVLMLLTYYFFNKWHSKHAYLNKMRDVPKSTSFQWVKVETNVKKYFTIYAVSMLASSIPGVLIIFFVRDKLNLEPYTGIFLLSYFLSGAIFMTAWKSLSDQYGKHYIWLCAMILAVCSFIWAYFLQAGDFWQFLIICIASGAAFGAELVLPPSILADHIQYYKKEKQVSFYFGLLAFIAKFALAIAVAVSFIILDKYEFTPGLKNNETSLQALSLAYAAIPCLIKLISIYLLWRYLNENKKSNINRSYNHV
ncbi:MAG: GPH family glycoside/pentoside/hexuronide:cation symporter [Alphaproteobacteria bacterium]|jgi:GPH family glycoside/pentoside/hexuronide:cation symporter